MTQNETKFENSDWIDLGPAERCPPGECIEVVAAGQMIAIFNVGGQIFGLDGVCPHQGGPLGKGQLSGHIVTCPWHGWQFDVTTGENQINRSICQPKIPVQLRAGRLMVRRADFPDDPSA